MNPSKIPLFTPSQKDSAQQLMPPLLPIPTLAFGSRILGRNTEILWEEGLQELNKLGFHQISKARSLRHGHALKPYLRSDQERLTDFGIWWHPAGVIAVGRSFMGKFCQIQISMELDVGTGSENRDMAWENLSGNSSISKISDGTSRYLLSVDALDKQSLRGFIQVCQLYGKLVPVEDWISQTVPFVDQEIKRPITSYEEWDEEKEKDLMARKKELERELVSQFPETIKGAFERSWRLQPNENTPRNAFQINPSFDKLHTEISECLWLAGIRWPSEKEKDILKHWTDVALGKHGEDPALWRAGEEGPAGLTLATVLLFSIPSEDQKAQSRLMRLIHASSVDTVIRWLQEPDAAHYTLGLRVIWNMLSAPPRGEVPAEAMIDIAEALIEKVGANAFRMETPGRTLLGLLLQTEPPESGSIYTRSLMERHKSTVEVVTRLIDLGVICSFEEGARWLHSLKKVGGKEESPSFLSLTDINEWQEAMEGRMTPSARELETLIAFSVMQKQCKKICSHSQAQRSRYRM